MATHSSVKTVINVDVGRLVDRPRPRRGVYLDLKMAIDWYSTHYHSLQWRDTHHWQLAASIVSVRLSPSQMTRLETKLVQSIRKMHHEYPTYH